MTIATGWFLVAAGVSLGLWQVAWAKSAPTGYGMIAAAGMFAAALAKLP